jgi:hypothetical protein
MRDETTNLSATEPTGGSAVGTAAEAAEVRLEDEAWSGAPVAATAWTCRRCGTVNKPTWRVCTGCEATADGAVRAAPPKVRTGPGVVNIVLGMLVVAGIVTLLVVFSEEIVDWFRAVAESVAGWFDRQFDDPAT